MLRSSDALKTNRKSALCVDLFIDFSYDDGANYDTTIKLVDGNNGSGGQNLAFGTGDSSPGQSSNPYTYNIPSGNDTVKIRVRSVGVDASEYYYIDNIVIRGTQIPEINVISNGNTIPDGTNTHSTTNNTEYGNTYYLYYFTRERQCRGG